MTKSWMRRLTCFAMVLAFLSSSADVAVSATQRPTDVKLSSILNLVVGVANNAVSIEAFSQSEFLASATRKELKTLLDETGAGAAKPPELQTDGQRIFVPLDKNQTLPIEFRMDRKLQVRVGQSELRVEGRSVKEVYSDFKKLVENAQNGGQKGSHKRNALLMLGLPSANAFVLNAIAAVGSVVLFAIPEFSAACRSAKGISHLKEVTGKVWCPFLSTVSMLKIAKGDGMFDDFKCDANTKKLLRVDSKHGEALLSYGPNGAVSKLDYKIARSGLNCTVSVDAKMVMKNANASLADCDTLNGHPYTRLLKYAPFESLDECCAKSPQCPDEVMGRSSGVSAPAPPSAAGAPSGAPQ